MDEQEFEEIEPPFSSDRIQDSITVLKAVSLSSVSFWWMTLFNPFSAFWLFLALVLIGGVTWTGKAVLDLAGIELRGKQEEEKEGDDGTDRV